MEHGYDSLLQHFTKFVILNYLYLYIWIAFEKKITSETSFKLILWEIHADHNTELNIR